jgi:hypothetical protein
MRNGGRASACESAREACIPAARRHAGPKLHIPDMEG